MLSSLEPNSKCLIIGNYGNDTLALIQWAVEQSFTQVSVLSVDTGWAAPGWDKHVLHCESWVRSLAYQVVRLTAPKPFEELIKQQGHFPTPKFQWCANALKGAPILAWLNQHDASGRLPLLLAHRRASARSKQHLPADIPESESFDERHVYYPLIDVTTFDRDQLLARAGFTPLAHRSLECNPCINSNEFDLSHLTTTEIERLNTLELAVSQNMFAHLQLSSNFSAKKHENIGLSSDVLENMGCGDPYGCGI
jgi:hypothetical protein